MDIPVELFLGFIGVSIAIALFGFVRNPQIPACLVMGGMFILFLSVTTDNIILGFDQLTNSTQISEVIVSNTTVYHYNIESSNTNLNTANFTGMNYGRAEGTATGGGSILVGDVLQCIDLYLAKVGLPTSPTVFKLGLVGVFPQNSNVPTQLYGSFNASELTTTLTFYTFCVLEGSEHIIQNGDRIGFTYGGGNSTNYVLTRAITGNPFDGTFTQRLSLPFGSTIWTGVSTEDMTMRMYDFELDTAIIEDFDQSIQPNIFEFTELPKVLFALIGVMCMLVGGLMVMRD